MFYKYYYIKLIDAMAIYIMLAIPDVVESSVKKEDMHIKNPNSKVTELRLQLKIFFIVLKFE